jgi:AcrR family transcriptional regulator
MASMATRKYQQRLRAEAAEETRRRILDAAYRRLRAAPSQPLSVDQVARAARVARSTVYLVFGSRAGLFDALAEELLRRSGFDQVVRAVASRDAREHLRGGIRGGVNMFAKERDVMRVLVSMSQIDEPDLGAAVRRVEQDRAGGMAYLAERLAEQGILRPDVTKEQAANLLWLLTSFDAFDQLYTGRGLPADEVAGLLIAAAERSLCKP